jgi:folate-binding protein YgfZ
MNAAQPPLVRLPELRLLEVTGSDATSFLQAQVSRRVDNLTPEQTAIAGWHDASGKVRAVFRIISNEGGYLIVLPASLAEKLAAALKMFVLRADVSIEFANLACAGLLTDDPGALDTAQLPVLPLTPNAVARRDGIHVVCVAPGCWHVIAPENALSSVSDTDSAAITAAEIRAGLPQVDERTTQRYVAQMLNLDKLDAIDFEKGCYPGQEVIARAQHLGSVKRRAQLFTLAATDAPDAEPASDTPLFDSGNEQIGEIIRCARDADGSLVLLAVVRLTALDAQVHLGAADGPSLRHQALAFLADQ